MDLDAFLLWFPIATVVIATVGLLFIRHESKRLDRQDRKHAAE